MNANKKAMTLAQAGLIAVKLTTLMSTKKCTAAALAPTIKNHSAWREAACVMATLFIDSSRIIDGIRLINRATVPSVICHNAVVNSVTPIAIMLGSRTN